MNSLKIKVIGGTLLFGGAVAWTEYDKSTNYTQVSARIENVEEKCYLKKRERGLVTKTTYSTKEGPCEIAELLAQGHPEYKGFTVYRTTHYKLSYQDPNGDWQSEKLTYSGNQSRRKEQIGDKMKILMHKTNYKKIRKI